MAVSSGRLGVGPVDLVAMPEQNGGEQFGQFTAVLRSPAVHLGVRAGDQHHRAQQPGVPTEDSRHLGHARGHRLAEDQPTPTLFIDQRRVVGAYPRDAALVYIVRLHLTDGDVIEVDVLVGTDGIDSVVRRTLWGDEPKREHHLHILGGFTFADVPSAERGLCILSHSRTVQGSGPRSGTTAVTDINGGCWAPTTPTPNSPATCTHAARRPGTTRPVLAVAIRRLQHHTTTA